MLEKHKDLKIQHEVKVEKQQEFKLIGSVIYKRGLFLFAYDDELNEVYKVKIVEDKIKRINNPTLNKRKSFINPNHKMLYASNIKNAIRKFNKLLGLCLKQC